MENAVIKVENVIKSYQVPIKEAGIKGSIKSIYNKKYQIKNAVNNVSFEIASGEFIGFVGANGAGKTTMIKLLSGIVHPNSGTLNVLGYSPQMLQDDFKRNISVTLGQRNQLWWDIPAIDSFSLLRVIYNIPDREYQQNLDELTNLLNVQKLLKNPLRNLSLGERMKMELIGALLHNPKVLFLDEPTIGLDITSRKNIREFLQYINREKQTTIMLTSHYLEDIEYLCGRIIAINNGMKVYDGSINGIKHNMKTKKQVIVSSFSMNDIEALKKYGEVISIADNTIKMYVDANHMAQLGYFLFSNESFFDISIEAVSLNYIFEALFK